MEGMEPISTTRLFTLPRVSRAIDFWIICILVEQKKWEKLCGSKLASDSIYVFQSETIVVFLELFKEGSFFRNTRYIWMIDNTEDKRYRRKFYQRVLIELWRVVLNRGGGVLCIFWVRGRAIGKTIKFDDFDIRNGIDFQD